MSSPKNAHLDMPGFNLPLNTPAESKFKEDEQASSYWLTIFLFSFLVTRREILMMRVMNSITDKPEWERKVFDKEITSKWREEVVQSEQDITPKMMDFIIKELQWKSTVMKETGFVRVFDAGVVKSDTAISKDLQNELKQAVIPLEDIPEAKKDYHPGSDEKVVNLVHPSLFPVIYGISRVLPNRIIGLEDSLSSIGQGELLPVPSKKEVSSGDTTIRRYYYQKVIPHYSPKFQWLPCDVELTEGGGTQIVSYINNVHPFKNRALYKAIEGIIAQTIPLWNQSLAENTFSGERIQYTEVEYGEHPEPEPVHPKKKSKQGEKEQHDGEEEEFDEAAFRERCEAWRASHPIILPEPEDFEGYKKRQGEKADLLGQFPRKRLQIIVKLANIELTPEHPEYEGGSWRIEGQLNERIAASAIYYYDSENITPSSLAFRQHGTYDFTDFDYPQGRYEFFQAVYGFDDPVTRYSNVNVTQELGSVTCKEGRLLTFPNSLQHRVTSFSLSDRTKPGHRKMLALFLIDPHRRVISSANVPPQREDWGREMQEVLHRELSERLPPELEYTVTGDITQYLMTMDEAKNYRLELMAERSLLSEAHNEKFEIGEFNLI
ncbi:hypothetical protein N7462_002257 [Penicillium macrosclerotiorum]|uniref:uncharacterized protein n=1 Tax=Penicillium macrosclerotiorum TaxID=303699 RepID=UPI0025495205|nr:uncharacterized protein N7462_002257 [Penicillium macrosclerotiorum]KAJ5692834.1 hypothetical protein N7462_002257 [Penicillium macrosclerotiorum]